MLERILIVSDEQGNMWMRASLARQGFSVTNADDADKGYAQLLESWCDLVVISLRDSTSGLNFIRRIRANPALRRVFILAIAEWGTGQPTMALTAGADGFESGPVDRERLIAAVARLMRPHLTMTARVSGAKRDDD
jgi:DNA-binding response OmpR family regulator